jgi:hypothetical protein
LGGHGIEALGQLLEFITAADLNPTGKILVADASGPLLEDSQRGQCFPDNRKIIPNNDAIFKG